jgi:hypothetical protein
MFCYVVTESTENDQFVAVQFLRSFFGRAVTYQRCCLVSHFAVVEDQLVYIPHYIVDYMNMSAWENFERNIGIEYVTDCEIGII